MGQRTNDRTRRTSKRSKENWSRSGMALGKIWKSLAAKTLNKMTNMTRKKEKRVASMVAVTVIMYNVTSTRWQKRDTCATFAVKRSPQSPGCDFT